MPLGVHALDIGVIVLALGADGRGARGIGTGGTAHEQAGAGADGGPLAVAADGCASQRTDRCPDRRAGDRGFLRRITGGLATDLVLRVLTTFHVVSPETLEGLASAGQDHDTWSGRDHGAGPQQQGRAEQAEFRQVSFLAHFIAPVAAKLSASHQDIP